MPLRIDNQPMPHAKSLQTLENMLDSAGKRIRTERDGDNKTSITSGDVKKWVKFNDQLTSEKSWDKTIEGWIEEQDGKFIPFQPRALTVDPDSGDVSVAMPSGIRMASGNGPGEIVALYSVNIDPIFKQKAELLIKFDAMLLGAARSLEESLPELRQAVKDAANDDAAFDKGDLAALKTVIRGVERARKNMWQMLNYRQKLATELAKMDPNAPPAKKPVQKMLDDILGVVNDLPNDYKYHSGWNHEIVLFHALKIDDTEAQDFAVAVKAQQGISDEQKKAIVQTFYDNAGSSFAPLILGGSGVNQMNGLAESLGMDLDFNAVKDRQKSHPVG